MTILAPSTPYSDPRPKATERQRDLAFLRMKSILAAAEKLPLSQLWRIEWSPRQRGLHVGEAAPALHYLQNRWKSAGLGWELVGYAGSEIEANKFADYWELYVLGES
jgi:hypothetical protein